jgi:phospholipase/carboxylesterase
METIITTFGTWNLRIRPGTSKRILLLLHGWTGDENSMSIFTRNLPLDYWILSPRAPYPATPSGYSWRVRTAVQDWPSVESFLPSSQALMEMIDQWAEEMHLDPSPIDIAGFSQGAAMTFTLGLLYPGRIGKMGILAGFAPLGVEATLQPEIFRDKTFFVAHGTLDQTVPVEMVERTLQLLKDAGAQVIYSESQVGHKLSSEGLKAFEHYLL